MKYVEMVLKNSIYVGILNNTNSPPKFFAQSRHATCDGLSKYRDQSIRFNRGNEVRELKCVHKTYTLREL